MSTSSNMFTKRHNQNEIEESSYNINYSLDAPLVHQTKLNHNASERHRRKRLNLLYNHLRSLLPPPHQRKKLTIPATLSQVLKYIPELQQQVNRQTSKKEELLHKISTAVVVNDDDEEEERKGENVTNLPTISAFRVNDNEIGVRILDSYNKTILSDILLNLEEEGLILLTSSSFVSYGGLVFYHLHLQMVDPSERIECEALSGKLMSMYQKQHLFG